MSDEAGPTPAGAEPPVTLHERVVRLEETAERDRRSLSARASKHMSLTALVISLVAGGYGLLDTFYFQRQRELVQDAAEVRSVVHRLTEINGDVAALMAKNEYASAAALMAVASNEKLAILVRAAQLIDKHDGEPEFLDPASYILLSAEQLNFADNELALRYADHALALSAASPVLVAEALRYRARVLFAPGKLQDRTAARDTYARAQDTVENHSSFVSAAVEFEILSEWLISEANFGDCAAAGRLSQQISEQMPTWKLPMMQKQTMRNTLLNNHWLSNLCGGNLAKSIQLS
jgi:hypothetical protein